MKDSSNTFWKTRSFCELPLKIVERSIGVIMLSLKIVEKHADVFAQKCSKPIVFTMSLKNG